MSGEPDSLVPVFLRRLDAKLDDLRADTGELKQRMTTLEIQVGQMAATEQSHYGQVMQRFDRVERRLDRVERRLEIADAPAP